ncbi:MAG: hypothetical protein GY859_17780, partial [Desulfobacterales bacterium]|nr:hypothetical protein [Desulfobacterales bacterium]
LEYFYKAAMDAAGRRTMSTVLLGQRRMGKTEIFKRVVNRLFFEQDPKHPDAVIPVYYSFPDARMDERGFAKKYMENFMRFYVGFHTRRPEFVRDYPKTDELISMIQEARSSFPFTRSLDRLLKWHEAIVEREVYLPHQDAVEIPRRVSDNDDSTIVMFLDEFQNTRLPHYTFDIVGFMQEAVESPTCPHFVTGSAMSILAKEIIGRGSLFGRFRSKPIEPLSEYWGAELARRAAVHYRAELSHLAAPVVALRCGGNPFYINAVIQQASEQKTPLTNEKSINKMLGVDLSSGFIWAELNDQVTKWIERVNKHGITKWVLYLSAFSEGDRIEPEEIQRQLAEKQGSDVSLDVIRDVLIRLSRGDLLEYMELGGWFRKMDDPILLDFLKAWGKFEVEGHRKAKVVKDTIKKYGRLKRRVNDQKGFLAEMYLSQILWSGQRKTFPGKYFHCETDVEMPDSIVDIRHRMRLDASAGSEVDVYASTGTEVWLCESKW